MTSKYVCKLTTEEGHMGAVGGIHVCDPLIMGGIVQIIPSTSGSAIVVAVT